MTLTADDLQRLITVVDAKATIEAGTATPVERIIAYASDTGEVGLWDGTTWTWVAGGSVSAADVRDAGHWEVIVSGSSPPVATTTEDGTDWVYGWVSA